MAKWSSRSQEKLSLISFVQVIWTCNTSHLNPQRILTATNQCNSRTLTNYVQQQLCTTTLVNTEQLIVATSLHRAAYKCQKRSPNCLQVTLDNSSVSINTAVAYLIMPTPLLGTDILHTFACWNIKNYDISVNINRRQNGKTSHQHFFYQNLLTTKFFKIQNVKYLSNYKMKYSKQMRKLFINKLQNNIRTLENSWIQSFFSIFHSQQIGCFFLPSAAIQFLRTLTPYP